MKELSYWMCKEDGYLFHWGKESPQWEDIRTELDMLTIEGKVVKEGESYVVPHDLAASFSRDERELLTLPAVFPYQIYVDKENLLQSNRFRFKVQFLKGDGTPFVNPKVTGSLIQINQDLQFMCNTAQYNILQAAKSGNESVVSLSDRNDIQSSNMRHVAQIKKNADAVDAKLDGYLDKTKVVAADRLNISVQKDTDGTYYVEPVLLDEEGKPVDSQKEKDFAKTFKTLRIVKPVYQGRDGTYYVFDTEQTDGLKAIKEKKKLSYDEAKKVLLGRGQIFPSHVFDFNREDYSDRVIGYGQFIKKNYPYLKAVEGGWLPPEGELRFEGPEEVSLVEPTITKTNVEDIKRKLNQAVANGETYIIHEGKKYPIDKVKAAIDTFQGEVPQEGVPQGGKGTTVDHGPSSQNETDSLNSDDNIEKGKYNKSTEEERNRRAWARGSQVESSFSVERISDGLEDRVTPFSYQQEGMQWMATNWKNGYRGVLLADDMGLGKTLQTLGFISGLKTFYGTKDMPSVLIVAPVSLLANWKNEYERFVKTGVFEELVSLYGSEMKKIGTDSSLVIDFSSVAKNRIVLTSYETLRKYDISFGRVDWSVMVLDEAQKVKNPASLITNCVKSMKYDFGIAITGTPVENAWVDLWSIMDFVDPGRLKGLKSFCGTYQNQLKHLKGDVKAIEDLGEQLEGELQPIFLRRQKADHLEGLPKKTIQKITIPMPEEQQKAYEKIIQWGSKGGKKKGEAFKVIAALRDTSLFPHLSLYNDGSFMHMRPQDFFFSSARLQAVWKILFQIKMKEEKVLIFVTSKRMQRVLKHFLEKAFGISIQPPINGELNGELRQRIVDTFNAKEGFAILILSAEAGGVGFNITAANHVIHLSRCWNPAKEDQATDRVYRIGQQKEVHVYLPIAVCQDKNIVSFDERLDQLLEFKRNLSRSVVFPTGDSAEDGYQLFGELIPSAAGNVAESGGAVYGAGTSYWTISDVDQMKGEVFEHVVTQLYDAIPGYSAEQTPIRNDYGADVIVYCDNHKRTGLLIQCKQTASTDKKMSPEGVEQICSAISFYEKQRGYRFKGVVITNAFDFTPNARTRAEASGVQLITRQGLIKLLERYRVEKDIPY